MIGLFKSGCKIEIRIERVAVRAGVVGIVADRDAVEDPVAAEDGEPVAHRVSETKAGREVQPVRLGNNPVPFFLTPAGQQRAAGDVELGLNHWLGARSQYRAPAWSNGRRPRIRRNK